MTPAIALNLWIETERLERLGWSIGVCHSRVFDEWACYARHWRGLHHTFNGPTREGVVKEAVRWAGLHSLADEVLDRRDTEPAPAMEVCDAE